MKALVHWKKHVLSDLGDIHMTKQLLNKKNINMDQRSLSRVSVEVFSSIEDWACKLLLGGGKKLKVGRCFVAHVFFFPWNTGDSIAGSATGTIQIVQWSAIWHLERSPQSLATGFFFYLPPKIMVHGMNERNFRGERNRFSCLCRFRFLPTFTGNLQKSLQGPEHLLGSPMSIVSLDVGWLGICWETDSKHSWTQRTLPQPEENWWKIHAKGPPFHCYPDHSRNRFKKKSMNPPLQPSTRLPPMFN